MANRFKRKILKLLSPLLVSSCLAGFLFQFNQMTNESYQIERGLQKISQLTRENERLELRLLENNHLQNTDLLARKFDFQKVGQVRYLQSGVETVVAK